MNPWWALFVLFIAMPSHAELKPRALRPGVNRCGRLLQRLPRGAFESPARTLDMDDMATVGAGELLCTGMAGPCINVVVLDPARRAAWALHDAVAIGGPSTEWIENLGAFIQESGGVAGLQVYVAGGGALPTDDGVQYAIERRQALLNVLTQLGFMSKQVFLRWNSPEEGAEFIIDPKHGIVELVVEDAE